MSVQKVRSHVKIEIQGDSANIASLVIKISIEDFSRFEEIWIKKEGDLIHLFRFHFLKMNWKSQLCLGALFIGPVSVVMFWLWSNTYLIIPYDMELKLGEQISKIIEKEYSELESPQWIEHLERVSKRLKSPNSPYQIKIKILDDKMENAFALPGGSIYISKGLIQYSQSAEEVYAVLAHEISHIESQHSLKQLGKSLGTMFIFSAIVGGGAVGLEELEMAESVTELTGLFLVLKFSREHEREADELALKKLRKANISARGFLSFFKRAEADKDKLIPIQIPGWLSTHPKHQDRVDVITNFIEKNESPIGLRYSFKEWEELKEKWFVDYGLAH